MAQAAGSMTSGPIAKKMILFALPLMAGNLFQQLYNTIDSLIVGNFLGSGALAAVSSSSSLIFMMIGFLSGVSAGAGVLVAQYFGAGENKNLHDTVHTMIGFGLLTGVGMTVAGVLLSPQILIWMGTPVEVLSQSVSYLQIYFFGSLGFVMYNIFVGILQAAGDGRHPLYYLMISSAVNLVLDLVFIGVFHTGVGGAALATVLSQLLSAALCLFRLVRTNESYRVKISHISLNRQILWQIIRIGLPAGIQNSIIAFSNVVVQSCINGFGEMAMAGCGAYSKIEGFAFLPINSFTMAITTFVGQNLGAKDEMRAKKGARFGVLATMLLAELIGLTIFFFVPQLVALFDATPQVVRFGVEKARSSCLFYFLLAYSYAAGAVVRGAGKTLVPMGIMGIFWCGLRIVFLAVTVPVFHSIQLIYLIYPVSWAISSVLLFFYTKKVFSRQSNAKKGAQKNEDCDVEWKSASNW